MFDRKGTSHHHRNRAEAKSLTVNKTPGPDRVSNEILKKIAEVMPGLFITINICITQAGFFAV